MVYLKALPFSFGECPYFQRVLDISRFLPMGYKTPKRMTLAGDMLNLSYKVELEHGFAELMVDADVFGVAVFGDAVTIHKCPFVNLFASSFTCLQCLLTLLTVPADYCRVKRKMVHLFQTCFFLKERTDIVFFDGGSNFQLAGCTMQAVYPRITVVHGLELVLSLIFEDIAKIEVVKLLTLQVKRLYRLSSWVTANHRDKICKFLVLHESCSLLSRHLGSNCSLGGLKRQKPFIDRAAEDVKDEMFWKRIFVLLCALYPLLKLLRMADLNKPKMDKLKPMQATKMIRMVLTRAVMSRMMGLTSG
eukprot:CCRYP_013337-RA/>CCRYP_013337-RA protein AED:0.55 eAED:0.25 QI:0/0/0/1/0.33/0.25/4/0/303